MSSKGTYRRRTESRARRVIRRNVTTGRDEPAFADAGAAAEAANVSDASTIQRWIADGKPHYGYVYRYETPEERARA